MSISREAYKHLLDKQDIKVKNYPSEAQVQLQVIKFLRAKGFVCGKIKTKGSFSDGKYLFDKYQFRGIADLLVFTNTRMYFIECKSEKGYLSQDQKDFKELCNKVRIPYLVVRRVEDVILNVI